MDENRHCKYITTSSIIVLVPRIWFFFWIHRNKLTSIILQHTLNLLFHWNEHNSQRLTQPQSTKDSPLRTSVGGGRTEGGGFWSWATWGGISYPGRRGASLTIFTSFTFWSSVFDRFDNHSDSVFSGSLSSNALVLSSLTFCFSLTILSKSALLSSARCENLQLSIKLHIPVLRKFLHGRFDSSSWRTISGFLKFRFYLEWIIIKMQTRLLQLQEQFNIVWLETLQYQIMHNFKHILLIQNCMIING